MEDTYRRGLEWNIRAYYFFRALQKRAYLPLIAVYAVSVAGLNLAEFGLVASVTAAVALILEVPSGYMADRIGHKKALIIGNAISALSPLGYILLPDFWGVLIGSAGYFGGYAFISGTQEAFMHETLLELGREGEYGKLMGRTQTAGLLGNVVLVALVPLVYPIDPRLPFLIGAILMAVALAIAYTLTVPRRTHQPAAELDEVSFWRLFRRMRDNRQQLLFLVLGMAAAAGYKISEFREIYFQALDIPIIYLGLILAASSLCAAAVSFNIHKLEFLSPNRYYAGSFIYLFAVTIAAGLVASPGLGIALLILVVIYNRNEHTLTHAYLLRDCPTQELKATYISMYAFAKALSGVWIPLLLGYLAASFGIQAGFAVFGVIMLAMISIIFVLYLKIRRG